MGQIFICYSHIDREYALQLKTALDKHGFDTWIDDGIEPGTHWRREIQQQLEKCLVVVLVMTPSAAESDNVQAELAFAKKLRKKVFPLLLEGDIDAWWDFSHIQYEDVRNRAMPSTKFFMRLDDVAPRNRELPPAAPAPTPSIQNIVNFHGDFNGNATFGNENKVQNTVEPKEAAPTPRKATRRPRAKAVNATIPLPESEPASSASTPRLQGKPQAPAAGVTPRPQVSGNKPTTPNVITIIVAVIGLVGTICVALITVLPWGQWLSPTPTATLTTPLVSPTFIILATETEIPKPPTFTPGITPSPTIVFTPTITPLPVEITDDKGVPMRLVPASDEFWMGSDKGSDDEKPVHKVSLDDFYMDVYEVANKRYKTCVDAGQCKAPSERKSYTRASYYGDPIFDDYPVIYVGWEQAKTYCEWRGARLPTEAEWEKAAKGTDARTYPWGDGIDCNKANYQGSCVGDTTKVGTYPKGVSPYGLHDMAGNVWEWVADWYDANYYKNSPSSNPNGPTTRQFRVMRGGSWFSYPNLLRVSYRERYGPFSRNYVVGFRCALSK